MAIYRVQRLYSDDGNSGMGTLGKVALGAAALGGGLMAGKTGMLGTTVQRGIGTGMAKAGNMVGSQAMINSGAKTVGKAAATDAAKGYGITLSRSGAQAAKETLGKADAATAFKDIAKQRVDASQGILNKYKLPTQNAFSEDTGAALQEAAIYGTVGAGTLGTIALAKRGFLGKTGKKAYTGASKKFKAIWNETNGKIKETATESTTVKKPGKPAQTTTKTTVKKVKFDPESWTKVRKIMVEKGMNLNDPSAKLKAAEIAGVKPISVK
jgi:hypothetical protein